MTWRDEAVTWLILALRVLMPFTVGMIVLTVLWTYAAVVLSGCWALAWLFEQTVSLIINARL